MTAGGVRRSASRGTPKGERLAEYSVPSMCPTMCAFGGDDLRTLFVTTARQMRDDAELAHRLGVVRPGLDQGVELGE